MTSYSETLTMKKLIKMRFFTIKIHYILLRMTLISHIPKTIFGVSPTLKDIGNQNFYYLYLLGILTEYLISYFGRFVAFSC